MSDSTAIVGDIHGCLEALEQIVEIATKRVDTVVFVGDYINRGANSAGVVEYLIRFKAANPSAVFLRGNHERDFEKYLGGDRSGGFFRNGGAKTLASYGEAISDQQVRDYRSTVPTAHRSFLGSLQDRYETDDLLVTHSRADDDRPAGNRFHISGHVPQPDMVPLVTEHSALIDTGCGTWPEAPLTCFFWPSRQWAQSG